LFLSSTAYVNRHSVGKQEEVRGGNCGGQQANFELRMICGGNYLQVQFWTLWDDTGRLGNILDGPGFAPGTWALFFWVSFGKQSRRRGQGGSLKELQLFSAPSPVSMVNPLQNLNAKKSGYCAMGANWFHAST